MHGPNGANYPNESVFEEVVSDEKIVIRHTCQPFFTLTITLAPREGGTYVVWLQEFDNAEIAEKVRQLNANEENLDRLHALLAGETPI